MGKGRKKGSKNKFTNLKAAFLQAFQELGHEEYVKKFAGDPKNAEAFLRMLAQMLPRDGKAEEKGQIIVELIDRYGKPEDKQ